MSEKTEVPVIAWYMGQRVDEMSREDLIAAVIHLGRRNQDFCEGATADRLMFSRIMKSARRR